ncbi:hypothetical protein R1sor_024912 [Riccia sorocarpa]|uniref:AB hydrolase-1 domain-containing protein n=1 Tax=Riccia sorocarpa TaxID=122646 RepID=A0ABD3GVX7_9MARC
MTTSVGFKGALPGRFGELVIDGVSFLVFAVLDIVDQLLCPVFGYLDSLFDKRLNTCYCGKNDLRDKSSSCISPLLSSAQESVEMKLSISESWRRISDTLYATRRKAAKFRLHLVPLHRALSSEASSLDTVDIRKSKLTTETAELTVNVNLGSKYEGKLSRGSDKLKSNLQRRFTWSSIGSSGGKHVTRWSDCGCEKCISWQVNEQNLYVHVDDKEFVASSGVDHNLQAADNNVVFFHGFLSSSSFWTDSVIPALPREVRETHRLFALDILGFGKSPKPSDCFYTLADHVDMIERSLLQTYGIRKFHLVAHSMGCIIALALAARFPAAVKSITLVAPILLRFGRRIRVIHGTRDSVVPFKQSETLIRRYPDVVLTPVHFANHASIVYGRESELAMELAEEFKLAEKYTGK